MAALMQDSMWLNDQVARRHAQQNGPGPALGIPTGDRPGHGPSGFTLVHSTESARVVRPGNPTISEWPDAAPGAPSALGSLPSRAGAAGPPRRGAAGIGARPSPAARRLRAT